MQRYMTLKEVMKVNKGFRLYKELAHAASLEPSTITEMAKKHIRFIHPSTKRITKSFLSVAKALDIDVYDLKFLDMETSSKLGIKTESNTFFIRCLGGCGRKFHSKDKAKNRLCDGCKNNYFD